MSEPASTVLLERWGRLSTHDREAVVCRTYSGVQELAERNRRALLDNFFGIFAGQIARYEPKDCPAVFLGIQEGFGTIPAIELWNLTAPVGAHPVGSTVSRQTLEAAGFTVPPAPRSKLTEAAK